MWLLRIYIELQIYLGLSDGYASKFVVKQWQPYIKKENERRYSYMDQNIAAAIVWLIKQILDILKRIRKRTIEKIIVG
jgi:hypothetical protein